MNHRYLRNILVLILFSVMVFGCKKGNQEQTVLKEAEISFRVDLVDPGTMKDWECKLDILGNLLEPDYAAVTIDGITYYPAVFRIDGILYTQSIKFLLPDGYDSWTYNVEGFVLYDDGGTPGGTLPESDDVIVMGTPAEGSAYEVYITEAYRLDYEITVEAFQKAEYLIEVLCFIDADYDKFGFDWFMIHEIVIREQCFFGDICIKDLSAQTGYAMEGSPYLMQSTGIQLDMPAIMKILVTDANGAPVPTTAPYPFTNNTEAANYGVGAPLCIDWPDHLWIPDEIYNVKIWIMVQDGDVSPPFAYKLFWTGTITELGVLYDAAGNLVDPGDDGIVEIVLGECNLSDADIQLVPYQNLPQYVDMYCQPAPYAPGDFGTYFDITLSGITGIYDIHNGEYGVFCCDQIASIGLPSQHDDTEVYGSMYPESFPAAILQKTRDNIDLANWLFNNLENYPGYNWDELQDALWVLLDDYEEAHMFHWPLTSNSQDMVDDAIAYGEGYLPLPGGWAAIMFWNGTTVQLVFTFVDP